MEELLLERYELTMERIGQIKEEHVLPPVWEEYFVAVASFLELLGEYRVFVDAEEAKEADLNVLRHWKVRLYEDVQALRYETSYTNPAYAEKCFGEEYGPLLAAVAAEMRSMIGLVEAKCVEEIVIRPELFVELYGACVCEWQESGRLPAYETLKEIVYWYVSDYTDITMERQFKERVVRQKENDAMCVPMKGMLQDEDWLKSSFLWDKALAKRRREVAETLQEKYRKDL